jgi:hypothetical protein
VSVRGIHTRRFHEIVYEDDDREDLNERGLKAGLELYSTLPERYEKSLESEQSDKNISDSEGSEYNLESDEKHKQQQKKKNKTKDAQRKDKHMKAKDKSELDTHGIMTLAGNNSNTSETIDVIR